MIDAFIGLGSNLENPLHQLQLAVRALQAHPDILIQRVSGVYRSAAVGPGQQPDYRNAVAQLLTSLEPLALLDKLQCIEHQQGRVRHERWGPRTLDLDILLYGQQQVSLPRLSIPHPALHQRHFVLYPLRELTGENWRLPDGQLLDTLLRHCPQEELELTGERLQTSLGNARRNHS